jgi:hypothetical protein
MDDSFTCIAVANLYQGRVCVHIGLDQPLAFTTDKGFFCSIHLVLYCAPQWKHFRSTRPLVSVSADPQFAQDNSTGLNDHLLQEGKTLQEDVDNFNILLDVYDCLPPRPYALTEREIWDSLDPMTPLGIPIGKRFFGQDYAGYIVRCDHKKELGSYLVRYDDGDHCHFKKGQLDELLRNHAQLQSASRARAASRH